jgi:rhodanese-related sulfurtransferase
MRNLYCKLLSLIFYCLLLQTVSAQNDSSRSGIRVADTLTPEQKLSTNRVILQSELDSIINLHAKPLPVEPKQPDTADNRDTILVVLLSLAILILVLLLIMGGLDRKKYKDLVASLLKQQSSLDAHLKTLSSNAKTESKKDMEKVNPKQKISDLETRIQSLTKEVNRLSQENAQLADLREEQELLREIHEELKQHIQKTFKIRHYPRNGEELKDDELLFDSLETERLFSFNVFEKYLKPVNAILDANKKDPANTPETDKTKLIELLVSLALLYIEYLYLRVTELSIGGKISERINTIKKAGSINESMLKPLDVEHGSKALVLYLALKEKNIGHLSYPVFDETNLNRK